MTAALGIARGNSRQFDIFEFDRLADVSREPTRSRSGGFIERRGWLILFDPKSYVTIDKNSLQQAASMHVRFLYDEMTFRFTFRMDGQPVRKTALTPFKGTNTLSPYVVIQNP